MARLFSLLTVFCAVGWGCASASSCSVSASTYSSRQSGVVSAVPFVCVATVSCEGSQEPGPLYARVGDRTLPAVRVSQNKYQVSWIEELSEASSGDREIHLYDEAGYTALRKAMRSDLDTSSVASLATVVLSHSTGYTGPWINTEHMAAVLTVAIAYVALVNRSRLLS